jgi:predicted Zn-dependent protease
MSAIAEEQGPLSAEACRALFERIVGMSTGGGQTHAALASRWTGTTKWMRNRVAFAAETQTTELTIRRAIRDAVGTATTTRSDDAGLREAVDGAEWMRSFLQEGSREIAHPFVDEPILHPSIWSDKTSTVSSVARSELARRMVAPVEAAGLFAAGTLGTAGESRATIETEGMFRYYPVTAVECSMSVRDDEGTASGWAGVTHHDLARIDPLAISARALDKCVRSANPKAIEPGRYTVILEAQAVHDLVAPLIEQAMERADAELDSTPFGGRSTESASKIGSRVIDARLTLDADPMDPEAAFLPFDEREGTPFRPVTWIERGVLKELAYNKIWAARNLGLAVSLLNSKSFHLRPAPDVPVMSVEEMVASTERGLLVTRFSNVTVLHPKSMLCNGFTRDGLWLVEHGKVAMPVKNFRFTDSPMFALNAVQAIGPTARVFSPGRARVVPALKLRELNFTSLADAV